MRQVQDMFFQSEEVWTSRYFSGQTRIHSWIGKAAFQGLHQWEKKLSYLHESVFTFLDVYRQGGK